MHRIAVELKISADIIKHSTKDVPVPLDELVSTYLQRKHPALSELSSDRIRGICRACIENDAILNGVLQPYIQEQTATALRRDRALLQVIAQTVVFDFECYGASELEKALKDLYSFAVRNFLLFLTGLLSNRNPFDDIIKLNWYRLYDREYVDENLFDPYRKHHQDVRKIVQKLEDAKKAPVDSQNKRQTVFKPFSFIPSRNVHRLRSYQDESQSPILYYQAKAVPSTTYKPSDNTLAMQRRTAERANRMRRFKQRVEKRQLCRKKVASHARKLQTEPERAPTSKVILNIKKYHKMRRPRREHKKTVKQTTAAILREKAFLEKLRKEEEKNARFLSEGTGNTEMHEARILKKEEDLEAAVIENEKKILDAMLSLEKAIAARDVFLWDIKRRAAAERESKKEFKEQRQAELEETILQLRTAVEQAQNESKIQLENAREKLLAQKKKRANQVKREKKALFEIFMQECEEERIRRKEVISKIREMETKILTYEKTFDFSTLPSFGHLTDMSLADLKDRLISLRFEMLEQLEKKKLQICKENINIKEALKDAVYFVEKERMYRKEQSEKETQKLAFLKQLRQNARTHPEFMEIRNTLIEKSRQRRIDRTRERESRLKPLSISVENGGEALQRFG
ncbi:uncharacterized protein LOC129586941 [Paramacrobiotus metropolitanus]|uniref:uncharacterized protein LOC129586941 n=1 Tax=Paramacrobiotus metropolitanus TaxID=2943436 RepID=UPI002445676F|nr:uncharacterized protein LOC129586941 [Paramacrobiotus metropolitanus]